MVPSQRKSYWERLTTPLGWRPVVQVVDGCLWARSSFFQNLITLFSCRRELRLDPQTQSAYFRRRLFWVRDRQTTIPFQDIRRIDYGFSDTGGAFLRTALEIYTVSFVLTGTDAKLQLFNFIGPYREPCGDTDTALEIIIGDDEHDCRGVDGGQGVSSREFVRLLQKYTGAPLV